VGEMGGFLWKLKERMFCKYIIKNGKPEEMWKNLLTFLYFGKGWNWVKQ